MRERVALYGGDLEAGRLHEGGWTLRARLPLGARLMVRILLADDQELVRTGFRMILRAEADFEVVGEAADGEEAVAQVAALRPDVVLMDIRMPRARRPGRHPPHPRAADARPRARS